MRKRLKHGDVHVEGDGLREVLHDARPQGEDDLAGQHDGVGELGAEQLQRSVIVAIWRKQGFLTNSQQKQYFLTPRPAFEFYPGGLLAHSYQGDLGGAAGFLLPSSCAVRSY